MTKVSTLSFLSQWLLSRGQGTNNKILHTSEYIHPNDILSDFLIETHAGYEQRSSGARSMGLRQIAPGCICMKLAGWSLCRTGYCSVG